VAKTLLPFNCQQSAGDNLTTLANLSGKVTLWGIFGTPETLSINLYLKPKRIQTLGGACFIMFAMFGNDVKGQCSAPKRKRKDKSGTGGSGDNGPSSPRSKGVKVEVRADKERSDGWT